MKKINVVCSHTHKGEVKMGPEHEAKGPKITPFDFFQSEYRFMVTDELLNELKHFGLDGVPNEKTPLSYTAEILGKLCHSPGETIDVIYPESFLHPRDQIILADRFIFSVNHREQELWITTHSVYPILRLLRRVRQTAKGNVPTDFRLSHTDIMFYWVDENCCIELPVKRDGRFEGRWPYGFFNESGDELFSDKVY